MTIRDIIHFIETKIRAAAAFFNRNSSKNDKAAAAALNEAADGLHSLETELEKLVNSIDQLKVDVATLQQVNQELSVRLSALETETDSIEAKIEAPRTYGGYIPQ